MRILYAASNNENAQIQLTRFLQRMSGSPHTIKIAAYIKSSPKINIDWTLDCLLNIFKPDHISLENENYDIYFDQIKKYNPDLIISDLEYFTSYAGHVLGIEVWQYSSSLLNFALTNDQKYNLGVYSQYAYLFNKAPIWNQKLLNIIENSSKNLVYSHLGDTSEPPTIKDNFSWVRPYHLIGKSSKPCEHNIVAAGLSNNKKIINYLQFHTDTVYFSNIDYENYNNVLSKNINNEEEYFCNLKNSHLFISSGQSTFIADAFYNSKYSIIIPDIADTECILNSYVSSKNKTSSIMFYLQEEMPKEQSQITPHYNSGVKYLNQLIEEL